MVPKISYPPRHYHDHLTKPLSPTTAQAHLAAFLAQTSSKPHLHPDAQLSTSGIAFSASSGPKGGLALHHLTRIEAGLRGESLVAETATELEERFGDEVGVPKSDDRRLDEVIEGRAKAGVEGKRKRSAEEVAQWAEETSGAALTGEGQEWDGAEDMESYELGQRPMKGEVGGREGAPVVKQGGGVPDVVEHDEDGGVVGKKPATEAEKKARREAKKARRKVEKKDRVVKTENEG